MAVVTRPECRTDGSESATDTLRAVTSADDRAQLRQDILDKAVVHGRVVLSSGKEADYYVDLRRVTLDGATAPIVGRVMLELTSDLDYDAVGGLTLGADPVATAMLHAAAAQGRTLDAFVVRKAEVVGVAVIVERGAAPAVTDAGIPYFAAYHLGDLGLG